MTALRNRNSSGREVAFWMCVLTALGAASGYFTAVRGGNVPAPTMALVGATGGAFIGVIANRWVKHITDFP